MKRISRSAAVAALLAGASAVVGCVSIEQTRAQLQSNDAAEIQKAENTIYSVATKGRDPSGFVEFGRQERIEYVTLAPNNDLLLRIIDELDAGSSYAPNDVLRAAVDKLDFTKEGLPMEIVTRHKEIAWKVWKMEFEEWQLGKFRGVPFNDRLFSAIRESDLVRLLDGDLDYVIKGHNRYEVGVKLKDEVARRLLVVTKDADILARMFDGDLRASVGDNGRLDAAKKLVKLADEIHDEKLVIALLEGEDCGGCRFADDADGRRALLSRLPEDKAVQYAISTIDRHCLYSWNHGDMTELDDGVAAASIVKKPESAVKIASAVLAKVASYRKECGESLTERWTDADDKRESRLIQAFPRFSEAALAGLICADQTSWRHFIDGVSANVAYDVLTNGKAKSAELELALVRKLPKERVDMAVYNGVGHNAAKKAVCAAMSPELKKQVAEAAEKAYAAIAEKAREAAGKTFELDGFYLGMSFDDMKIVFAHHFPDWQIEEDIDGEGKNADFVIYVPGQESPFCYADCGDRKVYQFNFGKKVLKKWYRYDVQDYAQWAGAYSREHKLDMRYKLIEKETTVHEPMDMSRWYDVWFCQHSYQYRHNTKGYRLTYFGDEKDYTAHGGLGGALIKDLAAPKFRYVRGDPGSLRAKIECD